MPAKRITKADRVARIFKSARESLGLTQEKVGKKCNTTQFTISNWERNYQKMSVENFELLCRILKIDPTEILKINEEK